MIKFHSDEKSINGIEKLRSKKKYFIERFLPLPVIVENLYKKVLNELFLCYEKKLNRP